MSDASLTASENGPYAVSINGLPTELTSLPITAKEFAAAMRALGAPDADRHVAVAVSGGPDSLALTFLAANWAHDTGCCLTALTVDHGLRPESAAEARQVGEWLSARGIRHRVLTWSGAQPKSGIQAAARAARYRLLIDWALLNGSQHLLIAHHQEDQAETLLLRAASGSGSDGLAGMAPVVEREGVKMLRPLLNFPRNRVNATVGAENHTVIDDPSNHDRQFARVRIRQLIDDLNAKGISTARLAHLADQFASLRRTLDDLACIALRNCGEVYVEGYVELDLSRFSRLPAPIASRVVAMLIAALGKTEYPPRTARLARLVAALRDRAFFRGATLGGCRFIGGDGQILVCRELGRSPLRQSVPVDAATVWWCGFQWKLPPSLVGRTNLAVGALGEKGWRKIRARIPRTAEKSLPGAVLSTLPALFVDGEVCAVPHLGYMDFSNYHGETLDCIWCPAPVVLRITPDCVASRVKETICNL